MLFISQVQYYSYNNIIANIVLVSQLSLYRFTVSKWKFKMLQNPKLQHGTQKSCKFGSISDLGNKDIQLVKFQNMESSETWMKWLDPNHFGYSMLSLYPHCSTVKRGTQRLSFAYQPGQWPTEPDFKSNSSHFQTIYFVKGINLLYSERN